MMGRVDYKNGNAIVIGKEFEELIYQRSLVLVINMCDKISRHAKSLLKIGLGIIK